jgi:hypothetical protein
VKPSLRRIWLYVSKTYSPAFTLPGAALTFICLAWTLLALNGAPLSIGTWMVPGILTTFFFLLFLRISDEIKDAEIDKSLFPERLLPSGKVTMADLRLLWWLSLAALTGAQFIIWPPGPFSAALIAYSLLMYKYFFLPGPISRNILLALLTHNPSMYILQLCALGFLRRQRLTASSSGSGWTFSAAPEELLACLLFYLPSLIWELSRKVRTPLKETSYQTYSSLLGHRTAAIFALAPAAGIFALVLLLRPRIGFSPIAVAAQAVILVLYALRILRFILDPGCRGASIGAAGRAYMLCFYSITFIDTALRSLASWGRAHA